jgi:hypothetical protein
MVGEQQQEQQWYLVDDEFVTLVSIDPVLLWLGGCWVRK